MISFCDQKAGNMKNTCELCQSSEAVREIPLPNLKTSSDNALCVCSFCSANLDTPDMTTDHWRCLGESMWSERRAVQIMSWRLLSLLSAEWARDLKDQLYLDDEVLAEAKLTLPVEEELDAEAPVLDSNGARLQEGDSVTLIKDLDVKGAGFTAKRGTLVKNISLTNNPKHVEGRVNGIQIVLVAAYLKKA